MAFHEPRPFDFVCVPLREDERLFISDQVKVTLIQPWSVADHPQGVQVYFEPGCPTKMPHVQYRIGKAWYVGFEGEVPR